MKHHKDVLLVLGVILSLGFALPGAGQTRLTAGDVDLRDVDVYEYTYRNWNNANVGVWSGMALGTNITGVPNTRRRVFIWFDVNSLRARVGTPSRVVLELSANVSNGSHGDVNVYRVTEPWDEGSGTYHSGQVEPSAPPPMITWTRQPHFDTTRAWSRHRFTRQAGGAWEGIDITALVQAWLSGSLQNYGLVLVAADETGASFKVDFPTSENDAVDRRPRLVVDGQWGGGGGGVDVDGGQLTITFCDGSRQTVQLNQSSRSIASIELGCDGGAPPVVTSPSAVASDASWKCTARADDYRWKTADFDDSFWSNAVAPWPNPPMHRPPQQVPNLEHTTAQWIWLEGDPDKVYCRKAFSVSSRVSRAEVRISVDNLYHVYVNGVLVGKESDPVNNWQTAEVYDVTQHLRMGRNVIAVEGQDLGYASGIAVELSMQ